MCISTSKQWRTIGWTVLFIFLSILFISTSTLSENTNTRDLIVKIYPQAIEAGTRPKLRVGVFDSEGNPVEGAEVFLHGHQMATTQEDGFTPSETSWGRFGNSGVRKLTARKGNQNGVGYLGVFRGTPEITGKLIAKSLPQVIESNGSPRVAVFTRSGEPVTGAKIIHKRAGPICATRNNGVTSPRDCGRFGSGSQGRVAALKVERGNQTGVVYIMVAPKGEKVTHATGLTVKVIPWEIQTNTSPRMRVAVYDMEGDPVKDAQVYLEGTKMAETRKNGLTPKDTDWNKITDTGIKAIVAKKGRSIGVTLLKVVEGEKKAEKQEIVQPTGARWQAQPPLWCIQPQKEVPGARDLFKSIKCQGRVSGYSLIEGIERHLKAFRNSNTILLINLTSKTDLTALRDLGDKYPELLPISFNELINYPLPLIYFSRGSYSGRVRGVIIADEVGTTLANLLLQEGVTLKTPLLYKEGELKKSKRTETAWWEEKAQSVSNNLQVKYQISIPNPANHRVTVEMSISNIKSNYLTLVTDRFSWYEKKHLKNIKLVRGDETLQLDLEKTSSQWATTINTKGAKEVEVTYVSLHSGIKDPHGDYESYIGNNFSFIDGNFLFLKPDPQFNKASKIDLTFKYPSNWRLIAPWPGKGDEYTLTPEESFFENALSSLNRYILLGPFRSQRSQVSEVELVVARLQGAFPDISIDKELSGLTKLTKYFREEFDIFPARKIISATLYNPFRGGAHRYNVQLRGMTQESWGLLTHEYIHLWNGDLITTNRAANWFKEGGTEFLTSKALHDTELLYWQKTPLFEAKEAYVNMKRQGKDEPLANPEKWVSRLIYQKGALVTALLDKRIQEATNGKKDIFDLFNYLFQYHRGEAIRNDELLQATNEVTGEDFAEFFDSYVYGTKELPLDEITLE